MVAWSASLPVSQTDYPTGFTSFRILILKQSALLSLKYGGETGFFKNRISAISRPVF
jgi:hypothetical protein